MKVCLTTFILLFTCFLFAQEETAVISGTIKNPVFYDVQFEYIQNPVNETLVTSKSLLDGNNNFRQEFNIDRPTLINISYNNKSRRIYLEPGDELQLHFNGRDIVYSMTFEGKGASNNNYLNQFDLKYKEWDNNDVLFYIGTLRPEAFTKKLNEIHLEKWSYLRDYPGKSGFSKAFLNFAYAEIDYWWAYNLLRYNSEKAKIQSNYTPLKGNDNFYSFLDKIDIDNEAALSNPHYHNFLKTYMAYRQQYNGKSRKKYSYNVEVKTLSIYAEPGLNRLMRLPQGTEVQYLSERSPQKATVRLGGRNVSDFWHKVRTKSGLEGWMFRGGLAPVKKTDFNQIYTLGKEDSFLNASKHITGAVLEYFIGHQMYMATRNNDPGKLQEKQLTTFIDHAKDELYKAAVSNIYTIIYSQQYGGYREKEANAVVLKNLLTQSETEEESNKEPTKTNTNVESPTPVIQPYERGVTQVYGKIKNPTSRTVTLKILRDFISREEEELVLNLDEEDLFNIAFEITEGTLATLVYDKQEKTIYLEPNSDLQVSFEGNKLIWTTEFAGAGAANNQFLTSFNDKFDKYNIGFMRYELAYREATDYRIFLDQIFRSKWDFFKNFDPEKKKRFSSNFIEYIAAEIDYWWAYNLLRYRWEHPVANEQPAPAQLDDTYYNFLNTVKANNERALNNQYYNYFIGLYFKLYQEGISESLQDLIKESTFLVQSDALKILATPNQAPILKTVAKGANLKYLNEGSSFKSTRYIRGKNRTSQWYKVRTTDNTIGWVFGAGGDFQSANQRLREGKTVERQIIKDVARVMVEKLKVQKGLVSPTPVAFAKKGDDLVLLGEKSNRKYSLTIGEQSKNDYFYKVKTAEGQIGWIFGGGTILTNKLFTEQVVDSRNSSYESIASDIFTGKVKYFALAQVIFDKIYLAEEPVDVLPEVNAFKASNPYQNYDNIIQETYNTRADFNYAPSSTLVVVNSENPLAAKKKIEETVVEVKPKIEKAKVKSNPILQKNTPLPKTNKAEVDQRVTTTNTPDQKTLGNRAKESKIDADILADLDRISQGQTPPTTTTKSRTTKPRSPLSVPKTPDATQNTSLEERSKESNIDAATLAWLDNVGKSSKTPTKQPSQPTATTTTVVTEIEKPEYLDIDTSPEERPTTQTNFSGKITNPQLKDAKIILYKNPVTFDEQIYNLYVRNDGTFYTKLFLSEPRNGRLIYGAQEMDIFLEPGDDINVDFQSIAMPKSIAFNGKGGDKNRYLREYKKAFELKDKSVSKHIEEDDPAKFKKFVKKLYESKLIFLKKFNKKNTISERFHSYAKAEIDYWYYYQLINYPWEHPIYKGMTSPMAMASDYYDFLGEVDLSPKNALPSQQYTYFLNIFFDNKEKEKENLGYTRMELAEKYLTGEALQYFKAKELARYCQRRQAGKIEFELLQFLQTCEYPVYKDAVKAVYAETRGLLKGMKAPVFTLKNERGQEVKLSDFKGKVVYIDFWATWCTLCLNDFPNAKRLKDKFVGKDVVFVYINLDENKKTWESYVRNHDMGGVQLYAEGSTRSEVAKMYGAKVLPLCILVDKDGKIGFAPAKRPSSPGAKEQINDLLLDASIK